MSETVMNETVLSVEGLGKDVASGESTLTILDGIGFTVAAGESVAIVGASGSGKSTLLRMVAGLLEADAQPARKSKSTANACNKMAVLPAISAPSAPRWVLCSSSSTWWTACPCW